MNAERLAEIRLMPHDNWRIVRELLDHIAQLEAQRGGAIVVPELTEDGILEEWKSALDCPRVEQTVLHVPGESRGNCFSATVAGLLKLPIEAIPQFAATDDKSWQEQFNEWLRQFGLAWFPMAGDDLAGECQQFGIEGLWSEMSGKSPRFDVGHSCVAKDGRLAWDPHPSQFGLERPIWWHGVFLALRPWEAVSRIQPIPASQVLQPGQKVVDAKEFSLLSQHFQLWEKECDDQDVLGARLDVVFALNELYEQRNAKGGEVKG